MGRAAFLLSLSMLAFVAGYGLSRHQSRSYNEQQNLRSMSSYFSGNNVPYQTLSEDEIDSNALLWGVGFAAFVMMFGGIAISLASPEKE